MATRENSFEEYGNDPNQYSYDGVNILGINKYFFQTEAYEGTGGFDNGKYLISHQREVFYQNRRQFSTYVNFVRPIIRAMVEPVFQQPPVFEYTKTPITESFVEDTTLSGISMIEFTEQILTWLRLHSVTFVVVDNTVDAGAIHSEVEAAETGNRPYAYIRTADKTKPDWIETSQFGELESIIFMERPVMVMENGECKMEERFRRWDRTSTQLMKKNENYTGRDCNKEGEFEIIESRNHNLGIVPVAVLHDTKPSDAQDILIDPRLRGVVRLTHSIYNKDSEIREIERAQGFSIFVIAANVGKGEDINTGAKNMLIVPADTQHMPEFVSPETKVLAQLLENRQAQKQDLFDLAEQSGVYAISKEAKSGLALSYEFRSYEETLKKSASLCEEADEKIMEIFERWTNLNTNFSAEYNHDFRPSRSMDDVKIYDMLAANPATTDYTMSVMAKNIHLIVDSMATKDELEIVDEQANAKSDQESRVDG